MYKLPENLESLHAFEDKVRSESLQYIANDLNLAEELALIFESMDHMHVLIKLHPAKSQDEITIQQLAIRMFNTGATSVKLALSGYYQVAISVMRDVLEVTNLLELFLLEPDRVADWREGDDKKLLQDYSPAKVRLAIEGHPEHTGQRRDHIYKLFSSYASHASPKGFQLVSRDGLSDAGPLWIEGLLKAWLEEGAMRFGHAALTLSCHFDDTEEAVLKHKMGFHEAIKAWNNKRYPKKA